MTVSDTSRTEKQIVDDANELARGFYKLMGYEVKEGFRFDLSCHPQERTCWNMAVLAYDFIQGTDVEGALATCEDES